MRITVEGVQVELNTLVVVIRGSLLAVEDRPEGVSPKGNKIPAHRQAAIQIQSGMFNAEAYEPEILLTAGERYEFLVQIDNNDYQKAKQPRIKILKATIPGGTPAPTLKGTP